MYQIVLPRRNAANIALQAPGRELGIGGGAEFEDRIGSLDNGRLILNTPTLVAADQISARAYGNYHKLVVKANRLRASPTTCG